MWRWMLTKSTSCTAESVHSAQIARHEDSASMNHANYLLIDLCSSRNRINSVRCMCVRLFSRILSFILWIFTPSRTTEIIISVNLNMQLHIPQAGSEYEISGCTLVSPFERIIIKSRWTAVAQSSPTASMKYHLSTADNGQPTMWAFYQIYFSMFSAIQCSSGC